MINGETPNFYPKLLDKDGCVINIGDTLFDESNKAWKIADVTYSDDVIFPLGAWQINEDGSKSLNYKALKPEWLSCENPNESQEVDPLLEVLQGWAADLMEAIKELPIGDYPLKKHLFDLHGKIKNEIYKLAADGDE